MAAQARRIDGKAVAAELCARIGRQAEALRRDHGIVPGLAAVLVGEDPASQIYVRNKGRQAERAGMNSHRRDLPAGTRQSELLELVARLNDDPAVNGILVQLPLPDHIDAAAVIEAVDPAKDVDGFHPVNAGRLATGRDGLAPCTPSGCMMLIERALGEIGGKNAVVVGRSNIVGRPLALMLLRAHCTVTVAHSRTRDLAGLCRGAEILVAATGRAEMIRGDWIKPGATVIDVGINRRDVGDGGTRLVGDVAFDEAAAVAGAVTPVPGGVGPMTVACLLRNTLIAACRQHGIDPPPAADG